MGHRAQGILLLYSHRAALGILLLQGPMAGWFLVSEVPLSRPSRRAAAQPAGGRHVNGETDRKLGSCVYSIAHGRP